MLRGNHPHQSERVQMCPLLRRARGNISEQENWACRTRAAARLALVIIPLSSMLTVGGGQVVPGKLLKSLEVHRGSRPSQIIFSKGSQVIFVPDVAGRVIAPWKTTNWSRMESLLFERGFARFAVSPDDSWLVTSNYDGALDLYQIRNWDLAGEVMELQPRHRLKLPFQAPGTFTSVPVFDPSSTFVAVGVRSLRSQNLAYREEELEHFVKLIELSSMQERTLRCQPGWKKGREPAIYSLAFSPKTDFLVGGLGNGTIPVWHLREDDPGPNYLGGHKWWPFSGAHWVGVIGVTSLSPDGRLLASGDTYFENVIRIWDVENDRLVHEERLSSKTFDPLWGLSYSSSGSMLVACTRERIVVFNTRTWETRWSVQRAIQDEGGFLGCLFSPDDSFVAVINYSPPKSDRPHLVEFRTP